MTTGAIDRAIGNMSACTACGLDGIPAALIKCLGAQLRQQLAGIFTEILEGEPILEDWLHARVILISKRDGNSGLLQDYRPLTVINALYRACTQLLKT